MVTFEDIAKEYAKRIKMAARQTKLEKTASVRLIKEAFAKRDPLLEVLKDIHRDLDKYADATTGRPFSDDRKKRILTRTGEILGFSEPTNIVYLVKEASNENAIELSTYMSQLINELQGKDEE